MIKTLKGSKFRLRLKSQLKGIKKTVVERGDLLGMKVFSEGLLKELFVT